MATLALTNDEIYAEIGYLLGISRDNADWDSVTAADVDRIVRSGRRRFFSAYKWNFLMETVVILTAAPDTLASITIASGVVTVAGDTFPSDAVNYVLAPGSSAGGVYSIASYDSSTQITLNDTSLTNATADTAAKLYKIKYDLPAAFGGWEGPISVGNDSGRTLNESRNIPEYVLRSLANRDTPRADQPRLFAVTSTVDSETAIATYQLQLYPLPDAVYEITGRYRVAPGDTLDQSDTAVASHRVFAEAYKECILAAAEVMAFDKPGAHSQRLQEVMPEAIAVDRAMSGVRHGRPRRTTQPRSRYFDLINGTVDLSGQEP